MKDILNRIIYVVVFLTSFTVVLMWGKGAFAFDSVEMTMKQQRCWDVGTLVEVAEQTHDPMRKNRQWQAWLYLANTEAKKAVVMQARAAHMSGVTSDEIYRECGGDI